MNSLIINVFRRFLSQPPELTSHLFRRLSWWPGGWFLGSLGGTFNARGPGLKATEGGLREAGLAREVDAVAQVRS
jgi:hypothetical protein